MIPVCMSFIGFVSIPLNTCVYANEYEKKIKSTVFFFFTGSIRSILQEENSNVLDVTKYLKVFCKAGKIYFGSHFQMFRSMGS
jgi:hypothetical protein